jgi:hypothetical protein
LAQKDNNPDFQNVPIEQQSDVGSPNREGNQDEEGVQIMRVLGRNMAWLMKLVENGKGTVATPAREDKIFMSFIH